jgi:hypothetical protein
MRFLITGVDVHVIRGRFMPSTVRPVIMQT